MNRRLRSQVAASVDAPPELVPFFDELFADMPTLGAMPSMVVRLARSLGVDKGRVLDLACGPGGVSVALAKRLGCSVVGVDACPAFIKAARALAVREGVGGRCRFIVGDIAGMSRRGKFDAVVMLNVWPVARAARLARRNTRPGGIYVIDDAVRDARAARSTPGLRTVPTLGQATRLLRELGDEVLVSQVVPDASVARAERALQRALRKNVVRLMAARPELHPALAEFLDRQESAAALLRGPLRGAVFVARARPRATGR